MCSLEQREQLTDCWHRPSLSAWIWARHLDRWFCLSSPGCWLFTINHRLSCLCHWMGWLSRYISRKLEGGKSKIKVCFSLSGYPFPIQSSPHLIVPLSWPIFQHIFMEFQQRPSLCLFFFLFWPRYGNDSLRCSFRLQISHVLPVDISMPCGLPTHPHPWKTTLLQDATCWLLSFHLLH